MNTFHRVVLIDLAKPHQHVEDALKNLDELRSLVHTYGGIDLVRIIQHKTHPDKNTFIGSGKVKELIDIVRREKISIVILNAIVNSTQLFHLTQNLWQVNPHIAVWDRVDLILNIFDKHARTAEAKLQIEIARIHHMGPRMYGLGGTYFSRQAGGIGTRGIGETNIERMKRHWKDQLKIKKQQLQKLMSHRVAQLEYRKQNGVNSVAIIGYTNAGKTSLFNRLTGKNARVKDALFVTLDSTVGKIKNYPHRDIIVSDTIGFIKNLPPTLIDSFKSTLLEALWSSLIVHVVDVSDDKMQEKIDTVEKIMEELRMDAKNYLLVFNKLDKLDGQRSFAVKMLKKKYHHHFPRFISVKKNQGIEELKSALQFYSQE